MFLVDFQFTDIERITPELTERHKTYLEKEYLSNKLMFGGRKVPRTGGIIISRHSNLEELEGVLNLDPFVQRGAATYSITEFLPVMASEEYQKVLV